jgi:thiol-disulfide isomerase/thioredoxin
MGNVAKPTLRRLLVLGALLLLAALTAVEIERAGAAFLPGYAEVPKSAATAAAGEASGESDIGFSFLGQPSPLPELGFVDGDGRAMSLADFRGRVVLLNIWATWCVPCRQEMPTLDRLQAQLGGAGFEVIALSIDRSGLAAVKPFYAQLGLRSLGIYLDQGGKATHALKIVGVPTTLLIDRDGREIGLKLGPAAWDTPEMIAVIRRYMEPGPDAQRIRLPVDGSRNHER